MPATNLPIGSRPDIALQNFISRYEPEIAARAEIVLSKMRARLPGAIELVLR